MADQDRIDALMLLDDGCGALRDGIAKALASHQIQGCDADDLRHYLKVFRSRFLDAIGEAIQ